RVYEKVLLGELDIDTSTLDALRPQTQGSNSMFESFNATRSSSGAGSTRKVSADGRSSPSKEDLRNSSIQASEDDIEKFTEVTVGQSWVLPKVVGKRDATTDGNDTPASKNKTVNGIPEQTFDDFEPFIVVPRSPRSAKSYRPNLKELPMPAAGPPVGTSQKCDVFKQEKAATTKSVKKTRSAPDLDSNQKRKIEFQDITLKKTTMSKQEAAQLHVAGERDECDRSGDKVSVKRPESMGGIRKKKTGTKMVATTPPGVFFFPTLLSAAPSINLAPVRSPSMDDDAFLYEDTSIF
ncbi:unnamed protein product, partial [Symbiodinium microadriaticum]